MKKYASILAVVLLLIMIISGCGVGNNASKRELMNSPIAKNNKEWVESIGLFDFLKVAPVAFGEGYEDGIIRIFVYCDNGVESYETFCKIINDHNTFVANNPSYFSDGTRIEFCCAHESQYVSLRAFSESDSSSTIHEYEEMLNADESARIHYVSLDLSDLGSWDDYLFKTDITFNVPILVLSEWDVKDHSMIDEGTYEILDHFANLEQVVIDYHNMEYDVNEVYNVVQKYTPGVRVFDAKTKEYIK